jgi:hypothetical protein
MTGRIFRFPESQWRMVLVGTGILKVEVVMVEGKRG